MLGYILGKRMKGRFLLVCASSALASQIALAAEATAELAKAKFCLNCHAVDVKKVGPAYRDVAAKYAGQKDAEEKLVQKVLMGGGGVWGVLPMPPNKQVSVEQAHVLVKWVLLQR
jgi:cytochrome c